jgi:hypothetical protein
MKIRPEQMKSFHYHIQLAFEERLMTHIRERYGTLTMRTSQGDFQISQLSDDCVLAMIRLSIKRALAYGITWESSTAAYTALMFRVGPAFERHPTIQQALLDPDVPDNSRVDHLCYSLSPLTWKEAKDAHGSQAWSSECPSLVFRRAEVKRA